MTKCTIDGCEKPRYRNGLFCSMHASRLMRWGDATVVKYPGRNGNWEEAFWSKVEKRPDGQCWPWTGAQNSAGYASMRKDSKTVAAHRVSYELHKGPIPKGLFIDHLCKNRLCVNPAHLEAVTHVVNMGRAKIDQCGRGHPYTPENTRINSRGYRECRTCMRLNRRAQREKALQLRTSVNE